MKQKLFVIAQVVLLALIGNAVIAGAAVNPQHFTADLASSGTTKTPAKAQPFSPEGTGFTYQGSLKSGGSPANGQYDFTFALFDGPSTPSQQVGATITMTNQTVTNGLFTVQLDFGSLAFQGDARWLEIAMRQAGGGTFTTLSPRQPLTPAPYAEGLVPGTIISGTVSTVLSVTNSSTLGSGIKGITAAGTGPYAGVYGEATGLNGNGVEGVANNGTGAWGVEGLSASGVGVSGGSAAGAGVYGYSNTGTGLVGYTGGLYGLIASSVGTNGYGVFGLENGGTNTAGVAGTSTSGYGGVFTSTSGIGVQGTSSNLYGGVFTSSGSVGAMASSSAANSIGLEGWDDNGTGAVGVDGTSNTGTGVSAYSGGQRGLYAYANGINGSGVYGQANNGTNAAGVYGTSNSGYGGYFTSTSTNGSGVYGQANSGSNAAGVYGTSSGYGVEGTSTTGYGGVFTSTSGTGVSASTGGQYGLYASTTGLNGAGVYGVALDNSGSDGVFGLSSLGQGVFGRSDSANGIQGETSSSFSGKAGVEGFTSSTNAYGVHGVNLLGYAGYFDGNVHVTGTCCSSGEGTIQIDDPTDPADKYLNESVVQSPDMTTVINGNTTTDAQGGATLTLPAWFVTANGDFRYQLTVMGQFAQAIVSRKVEGDNFGFKTDKPNVEVSWQVTGVRKDPYALAHPAQPEQEKPTDQQGKYLYPKELGQPESLGVYYEKAQPQQPLAQPTQPPFPSGH